ncbi:uncharacterized [Tachysurus ichikawai]
MTTFSINPWESVVLLSQLAKPNTYTVCVGEPGWKHSTKKEPRETGIKLSSALPQRSARLTAESPLTLNKDSSARSDSIASVILMRFNREDFA